MAATSEARGRRALLIGIDRYPKLGLEWQLEGCANDVAVLRDTLIRRFGFDDDQITILQDKQATRDGILEAMEALVERAGEGDEVVFFYSGHGSQQPDGPEADEADGFDETLVAYDSGRSPYPNRDISDDEIYLWLLRLTAKTPFVTLIFDCCHSGTILRAGKQRGIPADDRLASQLAARIPPESYDLLRGGEDSLLALQRLGQKYVALASCGSGETANEIPVGEQRRIVHGALTYFLIRTLMDPGFKGATWREVFESIVPQVTAHYRTQHPELEGARDREVFGAREIPPMIYATVESCEGEAIVLGAGKACGLTEGSQWDVYAPATRSVDNEAQHLGMVEVFEVGVTSSKARAVEQGRGGEKLPSKKVREAIHPGCRAVESAHSLPGVRLAVEIVAPPGHPSAQCLAERMETSKFLWKASCGSAPDAWVYLLQPRKCCGPMDPAPMLGPLSEETWAPVGGDGDLLGPAFPRLHPDAVESVIGNLENVARQRGVAGIRNTGSPLEAQVDFLIHRLEEGQCVPPALKVGDNPVFFEGDRLILEIGNRSRVPLYIYVLDIGLTGKVSPVFPALGSHEVLEGGYSIKAGLRPGEDFQLFIPEDFHGLCRAPAGMPVEGRETLKLFATPSRADFSVLYQGTMRFPHRTGWGLNDVLDATFHGGYGYMRTKEDWVAIERTFRLRSTSPSGSL